jgi:hypothetical protein
MESSLAPTGLLQEKTPAGNEPSPVSANLKGEAVYPSELGAFDWETIIG